MIVDAILSCLTRLCKLAWSVSFLTYLHTAHEYRREHDGPVSNKKARLNSRNKEKQCTGLDEFRSFSHLESMAVDLMSWVHSTSVRLGQTAVAKKASNS